jgi:hypothetical protein
VSSPIFSYLLAVIPYFLSPDIIGSEYGNISVRGLDICNTLAVNPHITNHFASWTEQSSEARGIKLHLDKLHGHSFPNSVKYNELNRLVAHLKVMIRREQEAWIRLINENSQAS